ncbi:unnamed protein product [Nezara viridula]|uniref:Tyrosine-protein phosphatase domain-containing protein n=1 Tax=Nezara viridula TaxID=85310 RepID=A0A9P0H496_NEZVI|nr:unnamed protein product [Nezara viridula]
MFGRLIAEIKEESLRMKTAIKVETHSCRHASKTANKEKNQNMKCIPYDYNRVVLDSIEGVPDSDYINASHVDVKSLDPKRLHSHPGANGEYGK